MAKIFTQYFYPIIGRLFRNREIHRIRRRNCSKFQPKTAKTKGKREPKLRNFLQKALGRNREKQTSVDNILSSAPPMRVLHDRDSQVSKELYMDNLTLVVGGRNLVEDAKLHLPQGRKYGLVGRNGIGKLF